MTLKVYEDMEQRSDEWFEARRGIVTASVVGKLITPTLKVASNDTSRGLLRTLVAERITGYVEETPTTSDMWRGVLDEPVAREIYSKHYAPVTECGFMVEDRWGFRIGYSPDGVVGEDGLIEVKSRKPKDQIAVILADEVPAMHMAQCQCGLLVSGRKWLDYISFAGGLPMFVKRVAPDPTWGSAILLAAEQLEIDAAKMIKHFADASDGLIPTERVDHDEDMEMVI